MLVGKLISKCVRQLLMSTTFSRRQFPPFGEYEFTADIYFQRLHSDCRLRAS